MKLLEKNLNDSFWAKHSIETPQFNRQKIKEQTLDSPEWLHFGAGNIFRGFLAHAADRLLDAGQLNTGIIAVDAFDEAIIHDVYRPYDNLSLLVQMQADGTFNKRIIGSVVESLTTTDDYKTLETIMEKDSLKMISFTITEKGYGINNNNQFLSIIDEDIKKGPTQPKHMMSIIASLLHKRFLKSQKPITLVAMDNCSNNGDRLKESVTTICKAWFNHGFVSKAFLNYVDQLAYPLTMIDKITPRPSKAVQEHLEDLGLEAIEPIVTNKKSFIAPFVNAETTEYLIIEDWFVNGRLPLDKAGIMYTDRKTVTKVETMKVTTCLNPLHTALAVSGCLLDYHLIADQMKDTELLNLIKTIGYDEGMKVVTHPGIIEPEKFLHEVMYERFSNPYIPDTPQRIATDTSQKLGIRFGETIHAYVEDPDLDPKTLKGIPMAIALWCRYLMGVDDAGHPIELSPDPMMTELQSLLEPLSFGQIAGDYLKPILSHENIFGMNLYEIGLGEKIENYFNEINKGIGSIRTTLKKYF